MKILSFKTLLGAVLGLALLAPGAQGLTRIEIEDPRDIVPEISVPGGHNVVLSFQNGRYVQAVWVDDTSILGVATDRPLCDGQSSNNCGFATTLRLTKLTGALTSLQGASFSQGQGRTTVLNVITSDRSGQNNVTYQFAVQTGGASGVSQVAIVPEATTSSEATRPTLSRQKPVTAIDIELVSSGMNSVIESGRADTSSNAWAALTHFFALVGDGTNITTAATESGVNLQLLTELERIGRDEIAQI